VIPSGLIRTEQLAVKHVRQPRDGVPIGFGAGSQCPPQIRARQPLLNILVFPYISVVIVGNEFAVTDVVVCPDGAEKQDENNNGVSSHDMLDFADGVAINKADKRGAQDALRDVRKQVQRNRQQHTAEPESMPVFLTRASRFADPGIDNLFVWTCTRLEEVTGQKWEPELQETEQSSASVVVPPERTRYLSEIAEAVRDFKREAKEESERAARADGGGQSGREVPPEEGAGDPSPLLRGRRSRSRV